MCIMSNHLAGESIFSVSVKVHAGEPIRLPCDKHNAPLLLFKMFISTELTNIYVLESISRRI